MCVERYGNWCDEFFNTSCMRALIQRIWIVLAGKNYVRALIQKTSMYIRLAALLVFRLRAVVVILDTSIFLDDNSELSFEYTPFMRSMKVVDNVVGIKKIKRFRCVAVLAKSLKRLVAT